MRPARTASQLPQIVAERAQLPQVLYAVMDTYRLAGVNWLQVIRCGALPTAAVAALQWLYLAFPNLGSLLANLFGALFATIVYAIGFHQVLLVSPTLLRHTPLHTRALRGFLLGLIAFIPVLLTVAGLWLLHILIADALRQPNWLRVLMPLGGMLTVLFASFSMVRFSFMLPAIALDRAADLPAAMYYSKTQFWRLWSGLMLTLAPVLLVAIGLQLAGNMPLWLIALRNWGIWLFTIALSLIYLTLNYLDYVAPDLVFSRDPRYRVIGQNDFWLKLRKNFCRFMRFATGLWQLALAFWHPMPAVHPFTQRYTRRRRMMRRRLAAPLRRLPMPVQFDKSA